MDIIKEIRGNPKDLRGISEGLSKLVPILQQDEDERHEIAKDGGIVDLVKLIKHEQPAIHLRAIAVCLNLCSTVSVADKFNELGGIVATLDLLKLTKEGM